MWIVNAPKVWQDLSGICQYNAFYPITSIILYLLQGLFWHFLNCQFLPDLLNLVLPVRINLNLNERKRFQWEADWMSIFFCLELYWICSQLFMSKICKVFYRKIGKIFAHKTIQTSLEYLVRNNKSLVLLNNTAIWLNNYFYKVRYVEWDVPGELWYLLF